MDRERVRTITGTAAVTLIGTLLGALLSGTYEKSYFLGMLAVLVLGRLAFTLTLPPAYWPLRKFTYWLVRALRREWPEMDRLTIAVTRASADAVEPPMHTFRTAGRAGDFHIIGFRPTRLEIQTGQLISRRWGRQHLVRDSDLPVDLPCGLGRLTITAFTENAFVVTERGTAGDEVMVRTYR
jgi:hypothetical protein